MGRTNQALDALIQGFQDGGCAFVANFPGFHSQTLYSGLGGKQISLNERIAYEMAYGASLAGKRSVVTMKGVGLNACADPFLHSVIAGVNAGLVIVVGDDVEVSYSPDRQDSRYFRDFFGGLWLEPVSVEMAYEMAYHAFEWSEKLDIPIVIRYTNQFLTLRGTYKRHSLQNLHRSLPKDREKFISSWNVRGPRLEQKNRVIEKFVEKEFKPIRKLLSHDDNGLIIFGNCQKEIKMTENLKQSQLQIYSYPYAKKDVDAFCKNKKNISIFEQGSSYGANLVENGLFHSYSKIKTHVVSHTGLVPNPENTWVIFDQFSKLFRALKSVKPSYVIGDEGQYTDENTKTIQFCLCMGASVGIGLGMASAGVSYPYSVVGDAAFAFGGLQSLTEAQARGLNMGVIVIDNGGAQSTGGQKVLTDIYNIPVGIPKYVIDYPSKNETQIKSVLEMMKKKGVLSVLFIKNK
jgi:indolepyruvate ferredoxin oxidoreductase alpha subunit